MTTVRRATPEDARAIAEVKVETWRATYAGVMPQSVLDAMDVDEHSRYWAQAATAAAAIFVAEQEGGVVGFVCVGPCRDTQAIGELYAIYVVPEAWSTGAGLALMEVAVEWLAGHGQEAILWVAEENPRARRFYERYGWVAETTRVEEVVPGAHISEVLYRLSGLDRALGWPVIGRYSRPAMARVWSEQHKLERWLDVELAALDAWAELGVIPEDVARSARAHAAAPTPERVRELEERTGHDLAAFVDAVGEGLDDEGRRWLHYGLTSSDVLDTALALQVQEAGALLSEGLERAFAAVVGRAEEHRQTLIMGRTHGVHAEPTTFGLKLAGWAFELDRDRARLERALEGMRVGKLSGAVGTYAATGPELERLACERLGLEPAPTRRRSSSATDTRSCWPCSPSSPRRSTRSRSRSAISRGPRSARSRSRSAPARRAHRRCRTSATRSPPSGSAGSRACVRGAAQVGLENVALWHERDISHSSAERVVIPDAFLAVDYMLDRFAWLVDGLVVHADRMRENLDAEPRPLLQPAAAAGARRVGPGARRRLSARPAPGDGAWDAGTTSASS